MPPTETADKTDGAAAIDGKDKCPYKLWDEETVFEGRWLRTKQVKFRTHSGQEGVWQSSHRVTKPKSAEVDGVDIIAVLKKNGKKYFIFVKQYRIPMGGFCLEFPAGLVDAGETAEQTAQRELKEETGYTASRILHRSRGMQGLDPGLTDDSIQFVTVEVDGDAPENLQPKQRLEADEAIEVVLVECSKALEYIEKNGSARVIFLVGTEEKSQRRLSTKGSIQEEAAQLGDILQVNVNDSYHQLVYKELVGFRWLAEMASDAAFVMKADEDTVVAVDRLLSHLRFSFPSNHLGLLGHPSISCIILQGIPPQRSPFDRWYVPEEVFDESVFPAYCNGPVYVMSRQTLASLVDASRSLMVFEVEDAFWTGVAARAAGVRRSCAAGVFSGSYETTSACGLFPGGSPALSAMPSHSHPDWDALSPSLALNSTWQTLRGVACRSTLALITAGFMSIFNCL